MAPQITTVGKGQPSMSPSGGAAGTSSQRVSTGNDEITSVRAPVGLVVWAWQERLAANQDGQLRKHAQQSQLRYPACAGDPPVPGRERSWFKDPLAQSVRKRASNGALACCGLLLKLASIARARCLQMQSLIASIYTLIPVFRQVAEAAASMRAVEAGRPGHRRPRQLRQSDRQVRCQRIASKRA